MKKFSLKQFVLAVTALSLAGSGFCASSAKADFYPIGRVITNKVEVLRAAAALIEGYNNHIKQANKEEKQAEVAKAFSSIDVVGIQSVPYFYPQTVKEKDTRALLLQVSVYLIKNQSSYKHVRPDAAFCALQTALYLYPSMKYQNTVLDEARQQKILQRAMDICPSKMKKLR